MVRQAHHERRSEDFEKALVNDTGPLTGMSPVGVRYQIA